MKRPQEATIPAADIQYPRPAWQEFGQSDGPAAPESVQNSLHRSGELPGAFSIIRGIVRSGQFVLGRRGIDETGLAILATPQPVLPPPRIVESEQDLATFGSAEETRSSRLLESGHVALLPDRLICVVVFRHGLCPVSCILVAAPICRKTWSDQPNPNVRDSRYTFSLPAYPSDGYLSS